LYTSRSTTAHRGQLHGREPVFDFAANPGPFGNDPSWRFAVQHVLRMQSACRDLLELVLSGAATSQFAG
jgi:hypothetical protein